MLFRMLRVISSLDLALQVRLSAVEASSPVWKYDPSVVSAMLSNYTSSSCAISPQSSSACISIISFLGIDES